MGTRDTSRPPPGGQEHRWRGGRTRRAQNSHDAPGCASSRGRRSPPTDGYPLRVDGRGRHTGPDGYGTISVVRPALIQKCVEFAAQAGVPVKWGHALETLRQDDDGVVAVFANGAEERCSFVVGCDGLRSNTRKAIFGEQPADYTGIATVRAISVPGNRLRD